TFSARSLSEIRPCLSAPQPPSRLTVDTGARAGRIRFFSSADFPTQGVMNPFPSAVLLPLLVIAAHGAFRREVFRQITPLATGAKNVEHGIHDGPHLRRARPPTGG